MTQSGLMYSPNSSGYMFGGLALPGHSASHRYRRSISSPYEYYPGVEVTDTGFTVYETRIGEYAGYPAIQRIPPITIWLLDKEKPPRAEAGGGSI